MTASMDPELRARLDRATVENAEALADRTRAEAEKARIDAAQAAKPAAPDPTAAATEAKTIAEADRDAAAARTAQISALIPDFSKVKESPLDVKDGPALGATVLAYTGLRHAAARVAARVPKAATAQRILVTADEDLAGSDAVYRGVQLGIAQLGAAVAEVQADLLRAFPDADHDTPPADPDDFGPPPGTGTPGTATGGPRAAFAASVVGAAAAALPGILSLFAAQRTVRSAAVSIGDLAAAAEVARLLTEAGWHVVHHDFRLLPDPASGPFGDLTALLGKRNELTPASLTLAERKTTNDALTAATRTQLSALEATVAGHKSGATPGELELLERLAKQLPVLTAESEKLARYLGLVDRLLAGIDAFTTAVQAGPGGSTRSTLATAALYAGLHGGDAASKVDRVLLVKSAGGQTDQATSHLPIGSADKFTVLAEVAITYLLLDPSTNDLVGSGTESALAMGHGTIGGELHLVVDALSAESAGGSAPGTGTATGWSRNNLRGDRTSGD